MTENIQKTLKNGEPYLIRKAEIEDAKAMVAYVNQIAGESDNLTFGPGEFGMTVEDEIAFIDSVNRSDNQLILLAVYEGRIIGNLSFRAGGRPRIAHSGEFGISVLKEFWGNGVAEAVISSLIDWAKEHGIRKIDLQVRDDNEGAIRLYKKLGFKEEGHISRKFLIDGEFYSVYYMGMEL